MLAPIHDAPLAYILIVLMVSLSLAAFRYPLIFEGWQMHPYSIYRFRRVFTVFTSLSVHVNATHLLVNASTLCLTLPEVEYMLVDDFGPLTGRLLLLECILFSALFSGLFTAIQYRNKPWHRSTGASALIWTLVLFYLMYFPIEPLIDEPSLLPSWPPFLLAFGLLLVMLVMIRFRTMASAIHLYGALTGVLLALAVRPEGAREVVRAMCPSPASKERDEEGRREDHSRQQSIHGTVEECALPPFASLDRAGMLRIQSVHPLGDRQC